MSTEQRLDALEQALGRTQNALQSAQRSLRRTRLILVACAAAGLAAVVVGAGRDNGVFSAREFVVVDANGRALARLGAAKGGGGLALLDNQGRLRVELADFPDGPSLHLNDIKGTPRAVLYSTSRGPALAFRDADGHIRLGAGNLNDEPNLTILNEMGQTVWRTH